MPVPKRYQKLYSVIVASQIKRLKRKGASIRDALSQAKGMADKAIADKQKES